MADTTYVNSTMPVFAMAKDSPRMPLPMMALLKLKTDIPKEVCPGCCMKRTTATKKTHEGTNLRNTLTHSVSCKIKSFPHLTEDRMHFLAVILAAHT